MNVIAAGFLALCKLSTLFLCWEAIRFLWRCWKMKEPRIARQPKSRIMQLVVEEKGNQRFNYWGFDEEARKTHDPVTGELIINGYTEKELNEIARRRSEWGL